MKEEHVVLVILAMVLLTAIILPYAPASISGQQVSSVQVPTCRANADCGTTNRCMIGKCANGKCEYEPIKCEYKECKKSGCDPTTGCTYEASLSANGRGCGFDRVCCNGECMTPADAFTNCVQGTSTTPTSETPSFTTREICEILAETKARKPGLTLPAWVEQCVKIAQHVDWGFILKNIQDQ